MLQWDVAFWGTQKDSDSVIPLHAEECGREQETLQVKLKVVQVDLANLWGVPNQNQALAWRQDHTGPGPRWSVPWQDVGRKRSYVVVERVNKRVPHSASNAKTSHCIFAVAVTLGSEVNFNFKKTWGRHARTEEISDPYSILISPETEYQSTVSLSYLFLPAWKAETGIKMSMMNVTSICSVTRDIKKKKDIHYFISMKTSVYGPISHILMFNLFPLCNTIYICMALTTVI